MQASPSHRPAWQRNLLSTWVFSLTHISVGSHISHISIKIKRCIGILSNIRHSVTDQVLVQLYYSLIYPFLTYSLITWGTTYQTALLPLITLQKRTVRIITFSEYSCHSSPLFRKLKILKVSDLLYLYCALFMYDYGWSYRMAASS